MDAIFRFTVLGVYMTLDLVQLQHWHTLRSTDDQDFKFRSYYF